MKKLSSGYIVSVVSSILLLLEVLGVKVNVPYVNEVMMAVLGVLIALGIVTGSVSGRKNKVDGKNEDILGKEEPPDVSDNAMLDAFGVLDEITDEITNILDQNKRDDEEKNDQ